MEIYEHYTNDFFEIEYVERGRKFNMPMLHYHNAYEIMMKRVSASCSMKIRYTVCPLMTL